VPKRAALDDLILLVRLRAELERRHLREHRETGIVSLAVVVLVGWWQRRNVSTAFDGDGVLRLGIILFEPLHRVLRAPLAQLVDLLGRRPLGRWRGRWRGVRTRP